jgi:DNA polymerase-3 subunit gamma/tau
LEKVVTRPDPAALQHVLQFWPKVLDEVKQRKITAQAWLLAGTPVAVDNGVIVVAFKSPIHKETVMKPIHREVIEPVFTQLMNGNPHRLLAVMESEWEKHRSALEARSSGGGGAPEPEDLAPQEERDELVEKAHALFGAEHVKVVE